MTEIEIEGILRLNYKDKIKPKPLIMVLKDRRERNNVLLAAKKLKQSSSYSGLFLSPELAEANRIN